MRDPHKNDWLPADPPRQAPSDTQLTLFVIGFLLLLAALFVVTMFGWVGMGPLRERVGM